MLRWPDAHRFRLYTARPEKHIHHYDQNQTMLWHRLEFREVLLYYVLWHYLPGRLFGGTSQRYYTWPRYAPVTRRLTCMLWVQWDARVGLQISWTHWAILRLDICVDLWNSPPHLCSLKHSHIYKPKESAKIELNIKSLINLIIFPKPNNLY